MMEKINPLKANTRTLSSHLDSFKIVLVTVCCYTLDEKLKNVSCACVGVRKCVRCLHLLRSGRCVAFAPFARKINERNRSARIYVDGGTPVYR